MGGADFIEAAGDQVEGFVPAGRFVAAVPLDEWSGQAVGAVDIVVAETPFDAEAPIVGGDAFYPVGAENAVVLNEELDLAADSAVGTGGADLAEGGRMGRSGLGRSGSRATCVSRTGR